MRCAVDADARWQAVSGGDECRCDGPNTIQPKWCVSVRRGRSGCIKMSVSQAVSIIACIRERGEGSAGGVHDRGDRVQRTKDNAKEAYLASAP